MNTFRALSPTEIEKLEKQFCRADDWSNVKVSESFNPTYIRNVDFSGEIKLGIFEKTFILKGGIKVHSGICNARIHRCSIGDNCLIENVHNCLANYNIGSDTLIQNVDQIYVDGLSTFGNGVEVSVLNETGGREVVIFDQMSSHIAYFMALYRHRPEFITRLNDMIRNYTNSVASDMGTIGSEVRIVNSSMIRNVKIGDACYIEGAEKLDNGSINSNTLDPILIGYGVIANDFIVSSGSKITDGVVLNRCFMGQACHFSHHYSAHDSVFFANCQGENGEACAIFAGPYTVTMHKSSLLIAGMFSFMNAGSGSNQSNHMYKLGPIHQGIVERGSKTTSDSYILWPAKVGAFSLIMGRHINHSDTSEIPFSYLIENQGETYLVPGINLGSVGTIRDAQKWPKRDNRKDEVLLDQINFNLLSPYTIRKMIRAITILRSLQKNAGENSKRYYYHSAVINNKALVKGIKFYEIAIQKFLGNSLISRLENTEFNSNEDICRKLKPDTNIGLGDWLDISGLIAPRTEIEKIMKDVESGLITNVEGLSGKLKELNKQYYYYEWTWAADVIEKYYGKSLSSFTAKDVIDIVNQWKTSVIGLDRLIYEDAKKEFSLNSKTSFGVDGTSNEKEMDFENVRGDFENNIFVKAVLKHIEDKSKLGDELISRVSHLV